MNDKIKLFDVAVHAVARLCNGSAGNARRRPDGTVAVDVLVQGRKIGEVTYPGDLVDRLVDPVTALFPAPAPKAPTNEHRG